MSCGFVKDLDIWFHLHSEGFEGELVGARVRTVGVGVGALLGPERIIELGYTNNRYAELNMATFTTVQEASSLLGGTSKIMQLIELEFGSCAEYNRKGNSPMSSCYIKNPSPGQECDQLTTDRIPA